MVIQGLGTYLPPWGDARARAVGPDEDALTMAVEAGRAALEAAGHPAIGEVVLVTHDLPLLEGSNAAALLGGLGLDDGVAVIEQVGGAPAVLDALTRAEAQTLVIGADLAPAGAAAAVTGGSGIELTPIARVNRSLPVRARGANGVTYDYEDPRLARERGTLGSLHEAGCEAKAVAVAGLAGKEAAALCAGDPPRLATTGASAALFALAAMSEGGHAGPLFAFDQAVFTAVEVGSGPVAVVRDEAAPQAVPSTTLTPGADIRISLPAYERAFDAKLRLEAARCASCGTLSYPPRLRCVECGSEAATEPVALPRDGVVYTTATIRVPVPGLRTPYSLAVVELGDTGVRVLVHVTGTPAATTKIDDRGCLVFRRVALRSGVPDYGYAFCPESAEVAS
jgi:uncharacterized OB-fold protein